MPACWVVGPIVTVDGTNKPRVATLLDISLTPSPPYAHSSAIYPERGKTWCLSYVTGADFAAIDADSECERVFEEALPDQGGKRPGKDEHAAWLDKLPTGSTAQAMALLVAKGASTTGLAAASRGEYIKRLGMAASGDTDFRPQGWHTQ